MQVVDTTGDFLSALSVPEKPRCFSGISLLAPDLIVLPDTYESRRRHQEFANGQRVLPFDASSSEIQKVDRVRPLNLVVQEARCSVTGWMENGERKRAQDLEAARLLLLERFDLKLGLWDLATNPVLRDTLLDPKTQAPVPRRRPSVTKTIQEDSARHSARAAEKREARRREAASAARELHRRLRASGWKRQRQGSYLILPLTKPMPTWPGGDRWPLVWLTASTTKLFTRVEARHALYNDLSLGAFVLGKREAFGSVVELPGQAEDAACAVLAVVDSGWGNPNVDWGSSATRIEAWTTRWLELLSDFVERCVAVRNARFTRAR